MEVFGIKLPKKFTSVVQLLTNSNVLLPSAGKRVELINFSGPKQSFLRRDRTDYMQCGTICEAQKSSSESDSSLVQGNPAAVSDSLGNPGKPFFRIIEIFLSWSMKMDI